MRTRNIFPLIAAGMLLLAGCQKVGFFGTQRGEIRFSTQIGSAGTKTYYADEQTTDFRLPIFWEDTDEIRVYSDKAVRRVGYESGKTGEELYYSADYKVIPDGDNPFLATLENLSNDGEGEFYDQTQVGDAYHVGNGLMWPKNAGKANFYAIYPRSKAGADVAGKTNVSGTQGIFTYEIPAVQRCFSKVINKENYDFTEKPDMSNAVLLGAAAAAQPATDALTNIFLPFYPSYTYFSITVYASLDNTEPIELESVKLVAAENTLSGTVKATCSGEVYEGSPNPSVLYADENPYVYEAVSASNTVTYYFSDDLVLPRPTPGNPTPVVDFAIITLPLQSKIMQLEFKVKGDDTPRIAKLYHTVGGVKTQGVDCDPNKFYMFYNFMMPDGSVQAYASVEDMAYSEYNIINF